MKLFAFIAKKYGYDSFYIMSESFESAIENLCKSPDFSIEFYEKHKDLYIVKEFGLNEPVFSENC